MNDVELEQVVRRGLAAEAVTAMPETTSAPHAAIHQQAVRLRAARRRRRGAVVASIAAVVALAIGASLAGAGRLGSSPAPSHRPSPAPIRHEGIDCTRLVTSKTMSGATSQISTFDANCVPVPLASEHGYDKDPALSADGSLVAWVHRAPGRHLESLIVLDRATGTRTRVARSPEGLAGPTFSPDGTELAYLDGHRRPQLYVVPVRGGRPTRLSPARGEAVTPAAWSPEGHRIAYSDSHRVLVVDVRSGRLNRLSRQPAGPGGPFWDYPGMGPGLEVVRHEGVRGGTFRVVSLDARTGREESQSPPLTGLVDGLVADTFGIHIAYAGPTSRIVTYDGAWHTTNVFSLAVAPLTFATVAPIPPLGRTPDGRTYGSETGGRHPDLVAAYGHAGDGSQELGYISAQDENGRMPTSPQQAVRWNDIGSSSMLLYGKDGVTILGLFGGAGGTADQAVTTYVETPPGATATTVDGTISQDGGCVYLDHDGQRSWLALPWGVHDNASGDSLVDADGRPVIGLDTTTAVGGAVVPGQTSTATCGGVAPLYVATIDGQDLTGIGAAPN